MNVIKALIITAGLLLASIARGDENLVLRMGAGFTNNTKSAIYSLGYESEFDRFGFYRIDLGAWTDSAPGHSSSPFGSALAGVKIGKALNLKLGFGALIMGYPDRMLGFPFNFTEEATLSYKAFGVGYKHISNGGLKEPNLGRDYFYLNLGISLN